MLVACGRVGFTHGATTDDGDGGRRDVDASRGGGDASSRDAGDVLTRDADAAARDADAVTDDADAVADDADAVTDDADAVADDADATATDADATASDADASSMDAADGGTGGGTLEPLVEVPVSSTGLQPALVWTGDGWGLAWTDSRGTEREIYFRRFDALGVPSPEVRITTTARGRDNASLAWNGSVVGLTSHAIRASGSGEDYFVRLSASGSALGTELTVSAVGQDATRASVTWSGTEWAAAYAHDYGYDGTTYSGAMSVARIAADGSSVARRAVVVGTIGAPWEPSITWTGSEYVAAWPNRYQSGSFIYEKLYTARIDAAGDTLGVLDSGIDGVFRLATQAWTGSVFGHSWVEIADSAVLFQLFDAAGRGLGTAIAVDDVYTPDLNIGSQVAAHDDELAVFWISGAGLYARRVSAAGVPIGSAGQIAPAATGSNLYVFAAAASDAEYAVAWIGTSGLVFSIFQVVP